MDIKDWIEIIISLFLDIIIFMIIISGWIYFFNINIWLGIGLFALCIIGGTIDFIINDL